MEYCVIDIKANNYMNTFMNESVVRYLTNIWILNTLLQYVKTFNVNSWTLEKSAMVNVLYYIAFKRYMYYY